MGKSDIQAAKIIYKVKGSYQKIKQMIINKILFMCIFNYIYI